MRSIALLSTGLLLAIGLARPAVGQDSTGTATRYHGYLIDTGKPDARIDDDYPSLARQLAIVDAVDVPPAVHAFFRTVPIRINAKTARPPGQYVRRGATGIVEVLPDGMDADKPILLHELLHAYHHQVVGLDEPAIRAAYRSAKASSDYPPRFQGAHFLENGFEYFAVTSTIYLFGKIRQPPFDCGVLQATQPDYLAFLAGRFGPHDCR